MNDKKDPRAGLLDIMTIAGAFGFLWWFLEALRWFRGDYWTFALPYHWLVSLVLCGALTAVLAVVGLLVGRWGRIAVILACAVLALGLWAALLRAWPGRRFAIEAFVVGVHLALVVYFLASRPFGKGRAAGMMFIAACLSGVAAMHWQADMAYFNSDARRGAVALAGPAALAAVAVLGWLGLGLGHWLGKRLIPAALALLVVFVPIAGHAAWRYSTLPRETSPGPHLAFILCDSMRGDYCSILDGHVLMPALERAAEKGVNFRQAHSLAPWTLPSMVGLMASKYPHSLTPNGGRSQWLQDMTRYLITPDETNLADLLAEKGYTTCASLSNKLLMQKGMIDGFDAVGFFPTMQGEERWDAFAVMPFLQDALHVYVPGYALDRPVDTSRLVNAYAEEFVRRHKDQPLYLWLHYMDPHEPYDPPERFRTMDGPWPLFAPSQARFAGPTMREDVERGFVIEIDPADRPYITSLYEGDMRYADERAGAFVDFMAAHGLEENAYVCITSDHGEELWDHGGYYHGHSLYNEQTHVPLVITGPGLAPRAIDQVFSHIDLMPTLAVLLDAPVPDEWAGVSLASALREGAPIEERPAFSLATYITHDEPLLSAVYGPMKFIHKTESGEDEGYGLAADPGEHHNLFPSEATPLDVVMNALEDWRLHTPQTAGPLTGDGPLDPETLNRLESLGYLGN